MEIGGYSIEVRREWGRDWGSWEGDLREVGGIFSRRDGGGWRKGSSVEIKVVRNLLGRVEGNGGDWEESWGDLGE